MSSGKRLTLLSKEEVEYLYGLPKLEDADRNVLFELSESDHETINDLDDDAAKIDYILQLGYFRVKQIFFKFTFHQVREDVWFVIKHYFPNLPFPKKMISKHHHYDNQKRLLKRFKYNSYSRKKGTKLLQQAKKLVRRHAYPRFIFDELLNCCHQWKIIMPAYSKIQLIVSEAIKIERRRLINKLYVSLSKQNRKAIDALLKNGNRFHQITLLKKDPKDFGTQEMRKEVEKQKILSTVYNPAKSILPKLKISAQNMDYYADLAKFYPTPKLKRFSKSRSRLYLMCYAHQRYLKVNDHLATFFSYRVNKLYQDGEGFAKEQLQLDSEQTEQKLHKAGRLIKLYSDKRISDESLRPTAFQIVPKENINQFAKDLTATEAKKKKYIWEHLEKQSRSITLNLRPVFQTISFNCNDNKPIKQAVSFLRAQIRSGRIKKLYSIKEVPLDFIPKKQQMHVIHKISDPKDKRRRISMVIWSRYEYMVYMQLNKLIESGQVFIPDSISYRKLEDDLIPLKYWLANREKLLAQLNLSTLNQPIKDILDNLNKMMIERYEEVNHHIETGQNTHIKFNKNKGKDVTWQLPYKKLEDDVNNPFYDNFINKNIGDVVRYAIESTGFDKKFKHIQPYYSKKQVDKNNLIAALIANGAGLGINKMADISDMNFNELTSTNNNFFTLKNLREANDAVVNQIARMPIFKYYTLSEYGIHASIDGQKVETKNHTIKARYSKKYFSLGKGVVSLKLVANHVPINDKIIGANEYEGHYLFDLVYNNSSDIDIYAVSGDMHSINRVNFALMYLFGYRFMPRFTNLPLKAQENLISFQNPKKWEQYIIKPKSRVNKALIIKEWDNILRILVSLAMKETTQATVVRKLASYKRNNPTLKALIEFDKIIMSLYMLDYIDDPDMRSNVHRTLNRGEALHQLISAIRKVSDNRLPGKTEIEMDIYNECTRLVANCIIYYNADLLSNLFKVCKNQGQKEFSEQIKRFSPVAWKHINLIGKYEFCQDQIIVNIQELIESVMSNSEIDFDLETPI